MFTNSLARKRLSQVLTSTVLFFLYGCSTVVGPLAPTQTPLLTETPVVAAVPSLTATDLPTATSLPTITWTPFPVATSTSSPTDTPTPADPPTVTLTPTITFTPTIAFTPTPDYPKVSVKMQANCRYGPGTAYLYRWGLYPGDTAEVQGRNWDGSWLWIHPFNLKSNCWASKIVFNETVDKTQAPNVVTKLPHTTFAGPPANVRAVRNGNQVTVTWDPVILSEDKRRGYLIEAQICENGLFINKIIQMDDPSYTFNDETHCKTKSHGLLYTAEKHGYSDPVQIPWP